MNDQNALKTLIIDNYDSYTFNLLQLCKNETNVVVIRNDQFTWEEFKTRILPCFDNIIISPGPGRPERTIDFGIGGPLLQAQSDPAQKSLHRPIFGICLGHQGIAHYLGGKVDYAPRIMHGRMSQIHTIRHPSTTYKDIMYDCPSPFWAVRYHSLVADEQALPECLVVTAYCYENDADVDTLKTAAYLADSDTSASSTDLHKNHFLPHPPTNTSSGTEQKGKRTIMGFQHKTLPLWGVQFHPESVSTECGELMMQNFAIQTLEWLNKQQSDRSLCYKPLDLDVLNISVAHPKLPLLHHIDEATKSTFEVYSSKTKCPIWIDPELLVEEMLRNQTGHNDIQTKAMSWLDSSRKSSPYAKMSILSVDPAFSLTYSTLHRQVNRQDRNGKLSFENLVGQESFFDYISKILGKPDTTVKSHPLNHTDKLSFEGGLIGYFGYEMKRESLDGYKTPNEQMCACASSQSQKHQQHPSRPEECCASCCLYEPDAAFHFIDKFWIFDHTSHSIYICSLVRPETSSQNPGPGMDPISASRWLEQAQDLLKQTQIAHQKKMMTEEYTKLTPVSSTCTSPLPGIPTSVDINNMAGSDLFTANVQHDTYLDSIQNCVNEIKEGESYEICLTTRFRCALPKELRPRMEDPALWRLYTDYLRKNNPAPFSALISFPMANMTLMSSSPERFLSVTDGVAEMKPIKGTVGRALQCVCKEDTCDRSLNCEEERLREDDKRKQRLWQDVKERAENLMIVDLIRNDLAQVCKPSSVQVPKLMHVETYEKVHHLVSTVRGTLRPHVTTVEAVRKCFPPGSMTGAPKLRSVQLLDQFEHNKPRGVYSGCLGYFSLNGNADFNVVIRTAVITSQNDNVEVSVGGGGAITFLSEPEQEWIETLLKTKSVAPSVKEFLDDL
ncbi:ADC synthase [Phycomyces blakesleeanus]